MVVTAAGATAAATGAEMEEATAAGKVAAVMVAAVKASP